MSQYLEWDDSREHDRQMWVKDCISYLCKGSNQWIPGGAVTSANFDYVVLQVIRNELNPEDHDRFGRLLHARMSPRVSDGEAKCLGYEAGDYSACLYQLSMALKWLPGIN